MADEETTETPNEISSTSGPVDLSDSGYSSRKLFYAVGTSVAVMLGGVFYAFVEGFRTGYDVYIAGLIAVLSIYTGGNVTSKLVMTKHAANMADKVKAKEGD